ncbi:hypothetical protein PIB30_062560 [Stylosanthes scabra]|uniref:Uncharacterized protein n=1 Tax=Stylosanthes scabra TaxID=79078 RepID=A0ABU6XJS0_9FABA|nr:hypothetical protein [Stylosanthes scabra]
MNKGPTPQTLSHSLLLRREERKKLEIGDGGGYYSPPLSGRHNFYTGAPIDASFAATRSYPLPLRFYTNFEGYSSLSISQESPPITTMKGAMGVRIGAWMLNGVKEPHLNMLSLEFSYSLRFVHIKFWGKMQGWWFCPACSRICDEVPMSFHRDGRRGPRCWRRKVAMRSDVMIRDNAGSSSERQAKQHIREAIQEIEGCDQSSKELSQNDSLAQVFRKEHPGHVRGVGTGPCPTQIINHGTQQTSYASHVDVEEYKKEIIELKADNAKEKRKR